MMTGLGYDPATNLYTLPMPSNMHTHFRHPSDPRFPIAVEAAAKLYHHVTAMPNLGKKDLIRTPQKALVYWSAIEKCAQPFNSLFKANVPLYLEPDTRPAMVLDGYRQGAWIAAKLYPKGGTNESDEGVDFREIKNLYPVFAVMEELRMILLIHAEPLFNARGEVIDVFDREVEALPIVMEILEKFPKLRIVFEHISTARAARFVKICQKDGCLIEATIAPQYLVWNRNKLFDRGMNPAWYSIPVLKREGDRKALIDFMLDGYGFLGTDSAPHLLPMKSKPCGCAGGVFNEPVGLYVYFRIFKEEGRRRGIKDWFERFVNFACEKGPAFYGIEREDVPMLMTVDPWKVPSLYGEGKDVIVPMLAGETIEYQLKPSLFV